MDVFDTINSLRAVRNFDSKPVENEKIMKILNAAIKAPSSANSQPWEFMVLRDFEKKKKVGQVVALAWSKYVEDKLNVLPENTKKLFQSVTELVEKTQQIPVIILACLDLDKASKTEESKYASIYPAVQNILLAAHALGLGTCLTTHGCTETRGESQVKQILQIPDRIKIAAFIYLGYPIKKLHFPKRIELDDKVHFNEW